MLFFLTACEEDNLTLGTAEELSPTESATAYNFRGNDFKLQDGHLTFATEEELYATVRTMAGNYDDAGKFFTNIPKYRSSRTAYLELIANNDLTLDDVATHSSLLHRYERGGESYIDHTVDDLGLEYLVNAAGILEAGPYIYDLSVRNQPVKIAADVFYKDASTKTFEKAGAMPIKLDRSDESGFQKVDVRTCRTDFTAGGNNHRITGQLERSEIFGSFGFLWNFNVRTRFFRKRLGVWFGVQADDLRSNWDLWINLIDVQGRATPTRFQGSHVARDGDQQNTRFILVEETTENSVYMSGQTGLNRSRNTAVEDGTTGECNCGL